MQQTHLMAENGLCNTKWPGHRTNIRVGCADSDVSSSYPSNQIAGNVSKMTTMGEFVDIKGYGTDLNFMRRSLMDLMAGHVNVITSMNDLAKLPRPEKWLELYQSSKTV